ncbi:MAG: T9SS type A sorting domain-containing protein [bacterium]
MFWDGRDEQNKNLPSGVYFISLTKGDEKIVKRIVLMR